jgi:DNA-binding winged helix-turn-helix (wHTH) protein/TolB-like protein/Tfp pilus assembly protein PilF
MQGSFYLGDWLVQPSLDRISRNGETVHVRAKVMDLLVFLAQHQGEVISKDRLLQGVWGTDALSESSLSRSMAELRHALEDDADQPSLIETIPKRGYRVIGPVIPMTEFVIGPSNARSSEAAEGQSAVRAQSGPHRWLFVSGAAALLILAIVVGARGPFARFRHTEGSPPGLRERPIAVLPFINLRPDADTDFLSFSLADAIIARLGTIRALDVRAASTVYKYRSQTPTPRQAADELNVRLIMTGSYLKDGSLLRVTPQMIDVATNETLYQEPFEIPYERLTTVQDHVATQVISALHMSLSLQERATWNSDMPRDPLAYEFFLRGRDLYEASRHAHGIEYFEKSVAIDPRFARAWAFLGSAYALNASLRLGGRELYDQARTAYEKAIALNPANPRPRAQRAELLIETSRVEEAVQVLRDLLREHPRDPHTLWGLAYAYRYAGMLEQSVAESERAGAVDPRLLTGGNIFLTYLYQGDYEKFLHSFTVDERSAYQIFYAGFARYHLKDYEAATRDFDRAYALDPSLLQARVGKALSHVVKGQPDAAMQLLRATEREIEAREVGDAEGVYKLAQAYAALDDKTAALRILRQSIEGGFFCYPYLRDDPLLANIREEQEYAALLDQARLRHESFKRRFF